MTDMESYDLIIVGAGPSGINCGIQAQKDNLSYCILEKGVLVNSIYRFPANMTFFSTSKNLEIGEIPFISHTEKPTRKEALEYYRRLAQHYKLNIHYKQTVKDVSKSENGFLLQTSQTNYSCKNIVVATGFYDNPKPLNIPGEELPKVKHYYDDAHSYIGMKIAVIGGANSACDVALETWNIGADVTMIVRQSELYHKVKYWILPNIKNRIAEGSIKAYFDSVVTEVTEDTITINTPDGIVKLENDYVMAMTGYKPDFKILEQLGVSYSDDKFKIPTLNEETLESNVPGVYLAGVLNGGLKTSSLFIENTRDHGEKIISNILKTTHS